MTIKIIGLIISTFALGFISGCIYQLNSYDKEIDRILKEIQEENKNT